MPSFTGTVKLKICEAVELKPTDLTTRHANVVGSKPQLMLIDPYVSINVDDILISRSSTKQRTFKPVWNEYFTAEVHGAQNLGFTVFHAALPSDDFVANCSVSFDELVNSAKEQGSNENDIWVSAIPGGSFSIALLPFPPTPHHRWPRGRSDPRRRRINRETFRNAHSPLRCPPAPWSLADRAIRVCVCLCTAIYRPPRYALWSAVLGASDRLVAHRRTDPKSRDYCLPLRRRASQGLSRARGGSGFL